MSCLLPPLSREPAGVWWCPACRAELEEETEGGGGESLAVRQYAFFSRSLPHSLPPAARAEQKAATRCTASSSAVGPSEPSSSVLLPPVLASAPPAGLPSTFPSLPSLFPDSSVFPASSLFPSLAFSRLAAFTRSRAAAAGGAGGTRRARVMESEASRPCARYARGGWEEEDCEDAAAARGDTARAA
eukprot:245562-Hanusia_phi.AAC.1